MTAYLNNTSAILATSQMTPISEMGLRYWAYFGAAFLLVLGGIFLALILWKRGQKALAILALLAEFVTAAALIFFAEGLRQPQEISDPGVPDIVVPDMPDLDLPGVTLPDSE